MAILEVTLLFLAVLPFRAPHTSCRFSERSLALASEVDATWGASVSPPAFVCDSIVLFVVPNPFKISKTLDILFPETTQHESAGKKKCLHFFVKDIVGHWLYQAVGYI